MVACVVCFAAGRRGSGVEGRGSKFLSEGVPVLILHVSVPGPVGRRSGARCAVTLPPALFPAGGFLLEVSWSPDLNC